MQQFKGGQSNPTYLLETPARRYVLRRKPPGKLLPSAHAVDREFRVISALHAQGFPVAEPVIYCADESVAGTAFYVMGFVAGRVFWNPEMPGSNPAERAAVYDAMNATIARLHSLDPAEIGLADFGRGENYVARQVDRWSKQYRASETQKIDEMERLIEWLPAHLPPAGPARLVHGDYRLDNMILDAAEPKVLAVLDWELSTLGDPLADFTYHLMQWHMPQEDTGGGTGSLVGFDLAALGIPSLAAYVDAYVARTGTRSAAASGGLSRLQFLPHRRDPARHRRPGARRHRDQRARRGRGADGAAAGADRLALRPRGRGVTKTVALALGGGGARSLAQIPVLEALDEIGVKPVAVAGVSFGAVIAAAYCAGMSGKAIRRAAIALAHDRSGVFSRLAGGARRRPVGLARRRRSAIRCCSTRRSSATEFLPAELPDDFADA